jgi:nicotinamidase/pyrazinamidase
MSAPPLSPNPETDVLIVVDMQPDFMPGGALPVPGGDEILPLANALMPRFGRVVATQDWHPPGHLSFASQHPGRAPFGMLDFPYGPQTLWPDHCVQGTPGAALHPALETRPLQAIFRKGMRREVDSYSGFTENDRQTGTGLAGYLRALGVRRVFLCGLATDFCVAATARDAMAQGFEAVVILDACRGIAAPLPGGGDTLEAAMEGFQDSGIAVLGSVALLG